MSDTIRAYADAFVASVKCNIPEGGFRAFYASVRIELNDHTADADYCPVGGWLHLACYAPNNYVRVYAAFTGCAVHDLTELPWQLVCMHDSAWREDGVLSTLLRTETAIQERAVALFQKSLDKLSRHCAVERLLLTEDQAMFWEELGNRRMEPVRLDVREALAAQTLSQEG